MHMVLHTPKDGILSVLCLFVDIWGLGRTLVGRSKLQIFRGVIRYGEIWRGVIRYGEIWGGVILRSALQSDTISLSPFIHC